MIDMRWLAFMKLRHSLTDPMRELARVGRVAILIQC